MKLLRVTFLQMLIDCYFDNTSDSDSSLRPLPSPLKIFNLLGFLVLDTNMLLFERKILVAKVSLNVVIANGMIINHYNSHLQLTDSVIYLYSSASGRVSHKHQIYLLSSTTVH